MEKRLVLHSNQPITDLPTSIDALGYDVYAKAISNLLLSSRATPLTIGIHGDWGTGKTSLMSMIEQQVNILKSLSSIEYHEEDSELERVLSRAIGPSKINEAKKHYESFVEAYGNWKNVRFSASHIDLSQAYEDARAQLYRTLYGREVKVVVDTVWFNTWEHDDPKTIWASLLATITEHLYDNPRYPATKKHLDRMLKLVERASKPASIILSALTRGAVDAASVEDLLVPDKGKVSYREELQQAIGEIVVDLGSSRDYFSVLLIIIDDLDRCSPDTVISLLERLKIFFDTEGCVFLLAASEEVIASGIEAKGVGAGYQQYFDGKGSKYLEKIIQFPFHIPPLATDQRMQMLKVLPLEADLREIIGELLPYFSPNPRQLKRFANSVILLQELIYVADKDTARHSLHVLARFMLIRFEWEAVYKALVEYRYWFFERLWNLAGKSESLLEQELKKHDFELKEAFQTLQHPSFAAFVKETPLLNPNELESYLSLTQMVTSAQV